MKPIAIICGVSNYLAQTALPCCTEDVKAIRALIDSTGRFDVIETIVDSAAQALKDRLRLILELDGEDCNEIFFYFSGHGYQSDGIFYFCMSDFNAKEPNVTGLSMPDLHDLLRGANPTLVTIVIDACYSGTTLIKREGSPVPLPKGEFSSFQQIASCLWSQISLAGDPLSDFTEAFCKAAIRKEIGPVYYTDINAALRDHYIDDERSPLFISQSSGREVFAADAQSLNPFREQFEAQWRSKKEDCAASADTDSRSEVSLTEEAAALPVAPRSILELVTRWEERIARPEQINNFIDQLFSALVENFDKLDLEDIFELQIEELPKYGEHTPSAFMARILSKEERPDEFVTAIVKRHRRKRSPFDFSVLTIASLYDDEEITESYELDLNINMHRAQLVIELIPNFSVLHKFIITISCAPSLEYCYIFTNCTRLARTDWNRFSASGPEIIREWLKADWSEAPDWIVSGLIKRFQLLLQGYYASITAKMQDKG